MMTFCPYCIPVCGGNSRFRGQNRGDFPGTSEEHAGIADSEGCERSSFAQDVLHALLKEHSVALSPTLWFLCIILQVLSFAHPIIETAPSARA